MALAKAIADGDFSDANIWASGSVPLVNDVVASNGYVINIDQNIDVEYLSNGVEYNWGSIPDMTSNDSPSGTASASSVYGNSSGTQPYHAMDRNNSTYWRGWNAPPQWIAYEFASSSVITGYAFDTNGGHYPTDFELQGWDGAQYVTIHTVSGNTNPTYTSGDISNTTAYIKYRLYVDSTATNSSPQVKTFALYQASDGFEFDSSSGGRFTMEDNVTVNCTHATDGLRNEIDYTYFLTYSGSGESTINASIFNFPRHGYSVVNFEGDGVLNLNGDITVDERQYRGAVRSVGGGDLVYVGNMSCTDGYQRCIECDGGTLSITGDINHVGQSGNNQADVYISNNCSASMTGNINIEGNGNRNTGFGVQMASGCTMLITGNLQANSFVSDSNPSYCVQVGSSCRLEVTGSMTCFKDKSKCVQSTASNSINIFSGPFISSEYGTFPIDVARMHLIPSADTYLELRDDTTNGALPPAFSAGPTRLVSPSAAIDAPQESDVRLGVTYASGSQTGTMAVPAVGNVALNVAVDDTFGTAALSASEVWDLQTSELTESGSIGERLKNNSTVETTGDQLSNYL
jgi:hypothetical protein